MHDATFLALGLEARLQLLWDEGEFITRRNYYECQISLFLLNGFFVEVFLNYEMNSITAILIQNNPEVLYAYVCDLNIEELQKLLK